MSKKSFAGKENKPSKSGRKERGAQAKKGKRSVVDEQVRNPDSAIRLNKYISNSGICSRREADIYIKSGTVTVNGEVITEMGYKVKLTDDVRFDGRRINPQKKEYVLLNKPVGFYVTGSYERNNRTVMDLVGKATKSRIVPVGDLETSSKGLLLFTNDGTLEKKLARKPVYQLFEVELNKSLSLEDLKNLQEGIRIKEGFIKPLAVAFVENKSHRHIGIEIQSSIPQVVHKLFNKLDYEVVGLDRVVYGNLTKKDLPRGKYRHLKHQEIINLGML